MMKSEGRWPHFGTKEWCGMYKAKYEEVLTTKNPIYKRVKLDVENAKVKWHRKNPEFKETNNAALQALRGNPFFATASKGALLDIHVVMKRKMIEMMSENAVWRERAMIAEGEL